MQSIFIPAILRIIVATPATREKDPLQPAQQIESQVQGR